MASSSKSAESKQHLRGRLIVHAPNVHTGGGAVLLNAIMAEKNRWGELVLSCDQRMKLSTEIETSVSVHRVEPKTKARLAAESRLRCLAQQEDVVLTFGNLPPIFRLKAKTVLFLQNRYLVDPTISLRGFRMGALVRLALERMWLRSRIGNADRILVQTASMAELVWNAFRRVAEVVPFTAQNDRGVHVRAGSVPQHDFIYVSSGEPHKNHRALIEAWGLLADRGVRPSLALTLSNSRSADLVQLAESTNASRGTCIVNLGQLAPQAVPFVLESSGALIFPSLAESFGLPLIEAATLGLPIIASELDYVRDVSRPVETFDPHSPRSIARAVGRFMGLADDVVEPVSAAEFLERVSKEKI